MREHFENLIFVEKKKVQNEYGDLVNAWVDGATFLGSFIPASSTDLIIAGRVGAKSVIHIDTDSKNDIDIGDTIKREKTGDIVRITTEAKDYEAPPMAEDVQNLAYYLAERVTL